MRGGKGHSPADRTQLAPPTDRAEVADAHELFLQRTTIRAERCQFATGDIAHRAVAWDSIPCRLCFLFRTRPVRKTARDGIPCYVAAPLAVSERRHASPGSVAFGHRRHDHEAIGSRR